MEMDYRKLWRYRLKLGLLVMLALLFTLMSIYWLAFAVLCIGGAGLLVFSSGRIRRSAILYTGALFTMVLVVSVFVRVFILEVFSIPSSSMEGSLEVGDKIMMSKVHYGPVLPSLPLEISWKNIWAYIHKGTTVGEGGNWQVCQRLKGWVEINYNDVLIFRHPEEQVSYVKRCIGLPGEEIMLKHGDIYSQGIIKESVSSIKHTYKIYPKERTTNADMEDVVNLSWDKIKRGDSMNEWMMDMTDNEVELLFGTGLTDSIRMVDFPIEIKSRYNPETSPLVWFANSVGPVQVPKKGGTVNLTKDNWVFYESIFRRYEKVVVEWKEGHIIIDGAAGNQYLFKNDYFFVLGDNRNNSSDSRYWGLVPRCEILGKAIRVVYSFGNDGFVWNRVMKKII